VHQLEMVAVGVAVVVVVAAVVVVAVVVVAVAAERRNFGQSCNDTMYFESLS